MEMQYIIKILIIIHLFPNINKSPETKDTIQNNKKIDLIKQNLELVQKNKNHQTDSFLNIAKITLSLSKEINYTNGILRSYHYIADIYKIRNATDSAILYYEKGLDKAKNSNNYNILAAYYWNLANIYRITGNYGQALKNSLNCKALVESKKTKNYKYQVYNLLALSYQTLMEYELALANYEKSANLSLEYGNEAYAGVVFANIGRLYYYRDSLEKALQYFEKGIELEEKHGLLGSAGNSYIIVGKIYLKLSQLDSARFYLEKANDYNKQANNQLGLANTLITISEYFYLKNDLELATQHIEESMKIAQKLNVRYILKEAYLLKSKINEKQMNYEEAYFNFIDFFEIHSSMYDVEKINQAKALEQKLIQQEKENELVELELEKHRTINTLLILLVSIVIIVGVVILIYLVRFRKLSKELKISKEKAEESDKLKSRFLQTISHEIRTPLNGIIGFSEMMRTNNISQGEMKQINDMINKNSDDLLSTIENLVDVAHLSTNQFEITKSSFYLIPLLESIIDIAKENVIFRNKENLELKFEKGGDVELYTDKNIIQKIILHLIKNAILYTEAGTVTVGYKKENSDLTLFVKDTGIGISKEKIDVIFSPFQQADEMINIKVGGTGLGLTIVNGLIQILGGKIWVGSELKKGSTFYISLPLN